jgi:hypothetical protein
MTEHELERDRDQEIWLPSTEAPVGIVGGYCARRRVRQMASE